MKGRPFLFYLAFFFIAGVLAAALLADFVAPYAPQDEYRPDSFHPPTRIRFIDAGGRFHLRPFVYGTAARYDANLKRDYVEDTLVRYPLKFGKGRLLGVDAPARLYILGADSRGRDLFSRILYGARVSLSAGLLGVAIAAALGFFVGAVSGYFGGRLDECLMRTAEFFIMIPAFYFLLALRGALPPGLGSREVYLLIVAVLGLIGWGGIARVIRGMVFSIRENDFVLAARVLGRGHLEILFRHIFAHTLSYLGVIVSMSVPSYILGEAVLSVLGLGIQEPAVSWGNLLTDAMSVARIHMHPWVLAPGLFIFLSAFSFNVLGDVLNEGKEPV